MPKPVDNLPCIRQVANDLNVDEYLLLDVDDADHLVKVLPSVSKKLFHLKICLELVKLLHLTTDILQAAVIMIIFFQISNNNNIFFVLLHDVFVLDNRPEQ